MKFKFTPLLLIPFFFLSFGPPMPRVLIFTKTAGYHHASIPVGVDAILKLGKENNFAVDTTSDAAMIQESNLQKYAAVIFLSTTGP